MIFPAKSVGKGSPINPKNNPQYLLPLIKVPNPCHTYVTTNYETKIAYTMMITVPYENKLNAKEPRVIIY